MRKWISLLLSALTLSSLLYSRVYAPPTMPIRGAQPIRTHPDAQHLVGAWITTAGHGTGVLDYSGYRHTAAFQGSPTWTPGPGGPVLYTDTSNYLTIPDPGWDFTNLTIICRFKPLSFDDDVYLLKTDSGDYDIRFYCRFGSDRLQFLWGNGAATDYQLATLSWASQWYTVAITFDKSTIWFYRDGMQVAEEATGTSLNATSNAAVTIGDTDGDTALIEYVYVYDRTLDTSAIQRITASPYAMFRYPVESQMYVSGGEEPPAGNPQVISIMMTTLPAWMIVGLAIGFTQCRRRRAA